MKFLQNILIKEEFVYLGTFYHKTKITMKFTIGRRQNYNQIRQI